MSANEQHAVLKGFSQAVNMSAAKLGEWLDTSEYKAVGYKASGDGESVVGYVHRNLAQRPAGEISETHWRYSLMNWRHDPAAKKTD